MKLFKMFLLIFTLPPSSTNPGEYIHTKKKCTTTVLFMERIKPLCAFPGCSNHCPNPVTFVHCKTCGILSPKTPVQELCVPHEHTMMMERLRTKKRDASGDLEESEPDPKKLGHEEAYERSHPPIMVRQLTKKRYVGGS